MRVARIMPVTSRDEQRRAAFALPKGNENRSRIVLRCTKRSRPRECPSRQLCATVTSFARPAVLPHRPIANHHTESRTKNILYLVSAFGERRATHTTSGMPSKEAASPRSSKRSIPNTMPRADILHVGLRVRSIRVAGRQRRDTGILHTTFCASSPVTRIIRALRTRVAERQHLVPTTYSIKGLPRPQDVGGSYKDGCLPSI